MEEAERVAKNRISTADGHCVNYEQLYSREMQKQWRTQGLKGAWANLKTILLQSLVEEDCDHN